MTDVIRSSNEITQRYSGAEIHRGLSIDNHKHLRELQYVLASEYDARVEELQRVYNLVNHWAGEARRLESAHETGARRCGWFGEGRGQCLLDEGHETHLRTRHHTCEEDGRLLDVALTGLAAVREAERRSQKAGEQRHGAAQDFVSFDPQGGVWIDMARYLRSPAGQAQLQALGGKKATVCQCDPSGQGALPCPVHDSESEPEQHI